MYKVSFRFSFLLVFSGSMNGSHFVPSGRISPWELRFGAFAFVSHFQWGFYLHDFNHILKQYKSNLITLGGVITYRYCRLLSLSKIPSGKLEMLFELSSLEDTKRNHFFTLHIPKAPQKKKTKRSVILVKKTLPLFSL